MKSCLLQVKEFHHFTNRMDFGMILDKPMDKMVSMLKDDEWRNVRSTISPTFSSGKLRRMKSQLNRCASLLVENLKQKASSGEPVYVKDYTGAFALDVIASTAFGLDINSQKDPKDLFAVHAKKAFNFSSKNPLTLVAIFTPFLLPLVRRLGVKFFPQDTEKFFINIVDQAMAGRTDADKEKRADFLQLMINAQHEAAEEEEEPQQGTDTATQNQANVSKPKKGLTYDEVLSQAFVFFIAGYATVADNLTFALYNLALHPEVQDKVLDDINATLKGKSEPDYDTLNKMQYLDMFIQESLRMFCPLRVDRVCGKDTEVKGIHIPKGMMIAILIQTIHMDPEAWPEPEKFDPERFSPEHKAERDPSLWQPFGLGPRQCVAMRLALMEMKMALVHLLQNFTIKTCKKTNIPIKRDPMGGQPLDVYLTLEQRQ